MKKFTKYVKEDKEMKITLEKIGTPNDVLLDFLKDDKNLSLNEFLKELIACDQDTMNIYMNDINKKLLLLSEDLESDERYKSDEEIDGSYSDLKLEEFRLEERDMSYMYDNGVFEATFVWLFNDESEDEEALTEGGYNTSVEEVMYATEANENGDYIYKYAINNWYPEDVYERMMTIIEEKLKLKYNHEYERGSLDSKEGPKWTD